MKWFYGYYDGKQSLERFFEDGLDYDVCSSASQRWWKAYQFASLHLICGYA